MKKESRGGARAGAGQPKKANPKVTLSLRPTPEARAALEQYAVQHGLSLTVSFEQWAEVISPPLPMPSKT